MEMELKAGAEVDEFALSPGYHRLWKGAGQAHRDHLQPPGAVSHGRHQHGVAKRRARGCGIDGKDIPAPG